jgi:hypothetical protein
LAKAGRAVDGAVERLTGFRLRVAWRLLSVVLAGLGGLELRHPGGERRDRLRRFHKLRGRPGDVRAGDGQEPAGRIHLDMRVVELDAGFTARQAAEREHPDAPVARRRLRVALGETENVLRPILDHAGAGIAAPVHIHADDSAAARQIKTNPVEPPPFDAGERFLVSNVVGRLGVPEPFAGPDANRQLVPFRPLEVPGQFPANPVALFAQFLRDMLGDRELFEILRVHFAGRRRRVRVQKLVRSGRRHLGDVVVAKALGAQGGFHRPRYQKRNAVHGASPFFTGTKNISVSSSSSAKIPRRMS